jgi:hypothetical protein
MHLLLAGSVASAMLASGASASEYRKEPLHPSPYENSHTRPYDRDDRNHYPLHGNRPYYDQDGRDWKYNARYRDRDDSPFNRNRYYRDPYNKRYYDYNRSHR